MNESILIEVYKTTVNGRQQADALKGLLLERFPQLTIDFDLDDCDRILRITSTEEIRSDEISAIGRQLHVQIDVLE